MWQGIIISIFLLSVPIRINAQNALLDSLLYYEHIFFKATSDSIKQRAIIKKINLYIKRGKVGPEVFSEIKRVSLNGMNFNKSGFLWNAIIISYLNEENDYADYFLNEYKLLNADSSIHYNFLATLVYLKQDSALFKGKLNYLCTKDTVFCSLSCLQDVIYYDKKNLKKYILASALVPGSGTILLGKVAKGLISTVIFAGSVVGIVALIQYGLYVNAALWSTGVGLKFYTGNIKLTQKTFEEKEKSKKNKLSNECKLILIKIMQKYPLTLKEL